MNELFPIKGYDEKYSITKDGRIWSHLHNRWRKIQVNNKGYQFIILSSNDKYYISRLVAETFIPNPENKPEVNHIDFNPLNNNVNNLEWVTAQENSRHSKNAGRLYHPKYGTNPSKYIGLCWNMNKWAVRKNLNGRIYWLGRYRDEDEAHRVYSEFNG